MLRYLLLSVAIASATVSAAVPDFPSLSGRVVDQAGLLDPAASTQLEKNSAQLEQQTGTQFVVVTVNDLQGYPIEEYGYQLGRHWGIGQKGNDNGVLLIVAPTERKVRIEVGYGVEGILTDALSGQIIQTQILPRFKQGDMAAGIVAGATAIQQVLKGETFVAPQTATEQPLVLSASGLFIFIAIMFGSFLLLPLYHPLINGKFTRAVPFVGVVSLVLYAITSALIFAVGYGFILFLLLMSSGGGRGGGGGFLSSGGGHYRGGGFSSGGGFSGGGGSFGGGGASGSW